MKLTKHTLQALIKQELRSMLLKESRPPHMRRSVQDLIPWLRNFTDPSYEPSDEEIKQLYKVIPHLGYWKDRASADIIQDYITGPQGIERQREWVDRWPQEDQLEWLKETFSENDTFDDRTLDNISKIRNKASGRSSDLSNTIIDYIDAHAGHLGGGRNERKYSPGEHDRMTHQFVPEQAFSSPVVPEGWTYAYTDRHGERIFKRPRDIHSEPGTHADPSGEEGTFDVLSPGMPHSETPR
jgi:hypothetical protein